MTIATPVLLCGGTEVHILALARALDRSSHRVRIVAYGDYVAGMRQQYQDEGFNVLTLGLDLPSGLAEHLRFLIHMKRCWQQDRPEIVHVQYLAPGLIPIIAARRAGVPVVLATVHQINTYGWKARWLLRFAARFCDAFFCVSEAVEQSWFGDSRIFEPGMSLNDRRHWTIHNPVEINDDSLVHGNPENDKANVRASSVRIVGVVGRLRGEKGQAVLLEAFAKIREGGDDLRLRVVGDGPDRAKLEARSRELGIADCVEWMGSRPPEEVRRLYWSMDVVAVPSLAEGFGLAAAEALAAGRPVVASDVGGLREVVRHGETGLLVPPGDASELAAALKRLLDDPTLATHLGAAGWADVADRFSVARFNARIEEAYRQLLGAPPAESAIP